MMLVLFDLANTKAKSLADVRVTHLPCSVAIVAQADFVAVVDGSVTKILKRRDGPTEVISSDLLLATISGELEMR